MGSPDWSISYQTKANRFNSLLGLGKNYRGLAPLGVFLPARAPALPFVLSTSTSDEMSSPANSLTLPSLCRAEKTGLSCLRERPEVRVDFNSA